MKDCKEVADFQKAYRALNYRKNTMKIWELIKWSENWCLENHIPQGLSVYFSDLVVAYADVELNEMTLNECFKVYVV